MGTDREIIIQLMMYVRIRVKGPSIDNVCTYREGVKPLVPFHCVLHSKRV